MAISQQNGQDQQHNHELDQGETGISTGMARRDGTRPAELAWCTDWANRADVRRGDRGAAPCRQCVRLTVQVTQPSHAKVIVRAAGWVRMTALIDHTSQGLELGTVWIPDVGRTSSIRLGTHAFELSGMARRSLGRAKSRAVASRPSDARIGSGSDAASSTPSLSVSGRA